jgi:hypothetical protein
MLRLRRVAAGIAEAHRVRVAAEHCKTPSCRGCGRHINRLHLKGCPLLAPIVASGRDNKDWLDAKHD